MGRQTFFQLLSQKIRVRTPVKKLVRLTLTMQVRAIKISQQVLHRCLLIKTSKVISVWNAWVRLTVESIGILLSLAFLRCTETSRPSIPTLICSTKKKTSVNSNLSKMNKIIYSSKSSRLRMKQSKKLIICGKKAIEMSILNLVYMIRDQIQWSL